MTDTTPDTDAIEMLREKVNNDELRIRVEDTPLGKNPTVSTPTDGFSLSQEEDRAIDALFNEYRDLLIELDDIVTEYDGIDRLWHMGRAINEDETVIREIADLIHLDISYPDIRRATALYELFPDGDYDPEHSYSPLVELKRGADSVEQAREAYFNVVNADGCPTIREVRAWSDVTPDADLDEVVAAVDKHLRGDPSAEKMVQSVHRVYYMFGADDTEIPSADTIREVIND